MKYKSEIEINQPIEKVVELFDNPDNMYKWMKGLQSFEAISGTPGQPGAKSRLKFKTGSREMEMVETITVRDLPKEFSGIYEAKGVYNVVRNFFEPLPGNKTLYKTEQEFQLYGFMKVFGMLMPGAFKKETKKHMESFKKFAESQ